MNKNPLHQKDKKTPLESVKPSICVLGVELKPFENKEIENYTYKDYKIINKEIKKQWY